MSCHKIPSGRESGQAVLLVIVGLSIFLIGALGIAIDGAQMYAQQQMARAAADAAAQAGILSIFRGTNISPNPFGTGTPPAAFTCTTSDGRTPCVYARRNGFGGIASDTVTVTFPTVIAGVSNLSSTGVSAIAVSVQRTLQTGLIRFIGPATSTIRASATAGLISTAPDCITALSPTANGAVTASNSAILRLTNCGMTVNSNSVRALIASDSATVQATTIEVVGGISVQNSATVAPNPTVNAPAVADPFADVPPPTFSASPCFLINTVITNSAVVTLNPGVYCGGLTISNSARVTFNPGTYVMLGGGFNASNSAIITGQNVTFYNTFDATHPYGSVTLSNSVNATLSASFSGSLRGMLFFQDRNAPAGTTDTFGNSASQSFTGVLYFPRSKVSFYNSGALGHRNIVIVADTVLLTNSATLTITLDLAEAGAPQELGIALVK